jgi:hypothetical protein
MNVKVATFYTIGEKIWYRQVTEINGRVAGVIEDVSVGSPTVSYGIRLDHRDRVCAALSQLLPRY